jgi:uncharacterized protein involved in type VI secretion and phage assembly
MTSLFDLSDDLLARLVERVEGRFYGKYRGLVVDNADPENRGRLRVRVADVLGDEVVSGWALPCAPYGGAADQGFFFIPEVGAGVWVEFEHGNLEYPIWVGTFWSKPGGASEVPKPGDSQSPPTRKIIRTLKGHSIEMEDDDDAEVFIITYNDGSKTNTVTMDKTGIAIVDANENKITLDDSGTLIEDKNQNKITMDGSGTVIEDKNQNKIEMSAAAINIFPSSICNLGSNAVNLVNNLPACLFTGAPHALDTKGHAKFLK